MAGQAVLHSRSLTSLRCSVGKQSHLNFKNQKWMEMVSKGVERWFVWDDATIGQLMENVDWLFL
jgi:hypothetical protein